MVLHVLVMVPKYAISPTSLHCWDGEGGGGKIKKGGGTKSQRDRRDLQYRAATTRGRHVL